MDIISKVRNFVESECKKPTSHYGYEIFEFHLSEVANYAEKLADKLNANKEVVLISAWLHDIGAIIYGRKEHHITGAKIAEEKLTEFGYPKEKIELVKKCILNHRGSVDNHRESIEEQIISEADALANIENVSGILKAAFIYEHLNQRQAKISAREKIKRKWNQLKLKESKDLVREKFNAAMIVLS